MEAVAILKEMNRLGGRKVPAEAPTAFVPAKYADYLAKARKSGEDTAYRHFWELCVILCLRDGLRSGDVFVPGSRRYADPATYLYTPEQWAPRRSEYCRLVGKPPNAAEALEQGKEELHEALEELEKTLAQALPDDSGMVRLDEDEHLVVPPLSAEDVPAEAKALKDELAGMLPFAPIASLLIELDARTHFLDCFSHAGGRKLSTSVETKRNILAVLIAMSTNLGLARMSEACGVSYDVLAWTMEWYVREETLREANTVIVDHHYGLELAEVFGGGTMSSSDGQRFPVRGKTVTGRNMVIHGGQVLSTYTHVSDQWSTYGTKIIVPTAREAHFVLDDFLGNATDLPVAEHATDSHGATLINFALFDLVGKALTPRLRDLTRVTLVRDETPTEIAKRYPHAGPLLGARWNEDLVAGCWPDLLRMAGSLKYGQATASLIVGKWSAASRQNTLAAALKEWGMLRRTVRSARSAVPVLRPARFSGPPSEPGVPVSEYRALHGRCRLSGWLNPRAGDARTAIAIPGDRDLLDAAPGDPTRRERQPPPGGGGVPSAELLPAPAVPLAQQPGQPPPGEGVQVGEDAFGDRVLEVEGPSTHDPVQLGQQGGQVQR